MKAFLLSPVFILIYFITGYSQTDEYPEASDLIGVWQDLSILGSGWSNSFLFFPEGEFKFFYSQMDCSKRDVAYWGSWKTNNDELILYVKNKKFIQGGYMIKSEGSCGSDSTLVEGKEIITRFKKPVKEIISVSRIYPTDTDEPSKVIIYIDGIKYYCFSKFPEQHLQEFEK